MGMLNAICCLYLAIVSQKPPPSCKSLELQKKLQYCYSTIVNLRWYYSSIVKQNNNFLFLPINICHFLSLHYLICSLSPEHSLSSLLSLVFVLQLLSPLLKPKTPCGGSSGRGRRGSSNMTLSSLWQQRGLCGSGGEVCLGWWSAVAEWVCGVS